MSTCFVKINSKPFTKRLYSDTPGDLTLEVLKNIVKESRSVNPTVVSKEPLKLDPDPEGVIKDGEVVGFSIDSGNIKESLEAAACIKENKAARIIMGGPFFDVVSAGIVMEDHDYVDFIIRGAAEETLPELYREMSNDKNYEAVDGLSYRIGSEIKHNKSRRLLPREILDSAPLPFRDMAPELKQSRKDELTVPVRTSVGCNGFCTFCYLRGSAWIGASAETVVHQFEEYVSFGFKKFLIVDDNFVATDKERVRNIAKGLINLKCKTGKEFTFEFDARVDSFGDYRKQDFDYELIRLLKEAGTIRIFVGVESGNVPDLKYFAKFLNNVDPVQQNTYFLENIKPYGIHVLPGFIMLNEMSTLEGVRNNIEFIDKLLPAQVMPEIYCYRLSFYPGSVMTNRRIKKLDEEGKHNEAKKYIYGEGRPSYTDNRLEKLEQILDKVRKKFLDIEKDVDLDKDKELRILAKCGESLKRIHKQFFLNYTYLVERGGAVEDANSLIQEHYKTVVDAIGS